MTCTFCEHSLGLLMYNFQQIEMDIIYHWDLPLAVLNANVWKMLQREKKKEQLSLCTTKPKFTSAAPHLWPFANGIDKTNNTGSVVRFMSHLELSYCQRGLGEQMPA